MSDRAYIGLFTVIGLIAAFVASGPLRHPKMKSVGTPLESVEAPKPAGEAEAYAEGSINYAGDMTKYPMLFIIVRAPNVRAPLAVIRRERPQFPFAYRITAADSMTGSEFYNGDVEVVARLDQDGVAGAQPGDKEAVSVVKMGGSRHVDLVIQ